jgi:asparagine synthase (glutamine-hydrolysing)
MCGIFGLLNTEHSFDIIDKSFLKGRHRGPETSKLNNIFDKTFFGFHRLAINGLNSISNQPIEYNNCYLICNGEIYNYKQLIKEINYTPNTNSDCEIILQLYNKYGIEYTLNILDGEFAFAILDLNINKIFYARDPYGVRPLYRFIDNHNFKYNIGFASELKCLTGLFKADTVYKNIVKNVLPGTYTELSYNNKYWEIIKEEIFYHKHTMFHFNNFNENIENILDNLSLFTINAVKKRVENTDRPVACLLSGGLDSSLVAAIASKYYKGTIETYSIGLEGSEDLKYSKLVADHIKSKHTQIIMSKEQFLNSIPNVIYDIESYDTTTVRASVGNWLIGKYIREHSEAKVVLNGDGADELMGGYLYMKKAPDSIEFDKECRRLLSDIHHFDVLRSDKSISSHGLEPRTPFLDRSLVMFYLAISRKLRYSTTKNNCEKFLMRKAMSNKFPDILPKEVLWRTKEAFSDGVSSKEKSWYLIIQEHIENVVNTNKHLAFMMEKQFSHNNPITLEQKYYRYIFETKYVNCGEVIPYFWMPKYVNAIDASARTLDEYK